MLFRSGGLQAQGKSIPLGITFGVFSFAGGLDPSKVLDEADRAMYAKKQADKKRQPR